MAITDGLFVCIRFLQYFNNKYEKEISRSTVRGYYKAVKLFAEVNDILLRVKDKAWPSKR